MQRYENYLNWQNKLTFLTKKFWVRAMLLPPCDKKSVTIKKISLCLLEEVNLNHRSHRSDTTRTSAAHLSTSRYNLVLLWYLPNISLKSKVLSAESLAKPKSSSVLCHAIKA